MVLSKLRSQSSCTKPNVLGTDFVQHYFRSSKLTLCLTPIQLIPCCARGLEGVDSSSHTTLFMSVWTIPIHVTRRARGPPDGRHDVTIPPATIGLNHWHIHVIGSSFVFCLNRWLTALEPYRISCRQGGSKSKQHRASWQASRTSALQL